MLRRSLGPLLLLFLVVAAAAGAKPKPKATPISPSDPVAWTSYGYDNQLQNAVSSTQLTLGSVGRLAPVWKAELDGAVYASPLSARVDARQIAYVGTEAGSVYALDVTTGAELWRRELGSTTTEVCGTWGITSTGAIDLVHELLYVISATGQLHALSLATGEEAAGYPRQVVSRPNIEYVWGGLRIAENRLYVPIASYCDAGASNGFPEGSLLAIPLDAPEAISTWDPAPGPDNLGGMWGWGGVSIDPDDGLVYTGVGNSHAWSDECSCFVDDAGAGNKIVALSPDLTSVRDSSNLPIPVIGDSDFGAAPLLFQPQSCPPLAAANNKDGTLYILDRTQLSKGALVFDPSRPWGVAFHRRAVLVRFEADDLLGAVRHLQRRRKAAWEWRQGLSRRPRLRLQADLVEGARRRESGDAARRGERPLRHRRQDRRVLRASRRYRRHSLVLRCDRQDGCRDHHGRRNGARSRHRGKRVRVSSHASPSTGPLASASLRAIGTHGGLSNGRSRPGARR